MTLTEDHRLLGWAWNPIVPDEPVHLGVYSGEDLLFDFRPSEHGRFLERHGKGHGRHVFNVKLPDSVLKSNIHRLAVRVVEPCVNLDGSPVELYR